MGPHALRRKGRERVRVAHVPQPVPPLDSTHRQLPQPPRERHAPSQH